MSSNNKQMHLGVFMYGHGQHIGSWRYDNTDSDKLLDLSFYRDFAKIAERGKLDAILLLEQLAIDDRDGKVLEDRSFPTLDALTILNIMSEVTEKIGLVATLSTTYNDPFHTAARFAALDRLSGGRAGWNMVTSQNDRVAYNYSRESHMEHGLRYQRAAEYIDVVKKFWDSWEDDAQLAHPASGLLANPLKIHEVDHSGQFFKVSGTSYFPRPIQGHPVLLQAGSSESGKHFAAQKAEVVFTAQDNLKDAQAFYTSLKGLLGQYGRTPDQLHILPGLAPILGSTVREAKEREAYFNDLISPQSAIKTLSIKMDFDLSSYPIDGPLPYSEFNVEANNNKKARLQLLIDLAKRNNWSIRQLSKHNLAAGGHNSFVGTPEQLADLMQEWQDKGACDGFTLMTSHYLGGLEEFVDHVVPILQRRGLFRTEYSGITLRDHLGLTRPVNPWA